MTDSSDPKARPPRRPDASREPPTIDLKAKVVDDGTRPVPPIPDEPDAAPTHAAGTETGARGTGAPETGTSEPETAETRSGPAAGDDVTPDAPVSDPDMSGLETAPGAAAEPAGGFDSQRPPVHEPPPRPATGFGPVAAAGLLGGIVGAGLVLAYDLWGGGPVRDDPRLAQFEQRLAAVPRSDALQRLEARLGTLEGAQGSINQRLQAAQALADKANSRAEEIAARPIPASQAAGPAPQTSAALADLGNRLGALETRTREGAQAASSAAQANASAVQGLDKRLGDVDGRLGGLDRRLGDADSRLGSLDKRLGEQDQKLAALVRQVAEGGSEATRAGTRVVLTDRLNDALREGAPYADILAALGRFNVEPARLQPLEPFASGGAPTPETLAQRFKPLSEQMLRDARPEGGSWTDRLTRMAERVVTVRAVDGPSGGAGGVQGLVARIDDALARGALADAAAAWDALPEPARRLSEEWGRQLKQRLAAETAARALAADAVAALNPTTR